MGKVLFKRIVVLFPILTLLLLLPLGQFGAVKLDAADVRINLLFIDVGMFVAGLVGVYYRNSTKKAQKLFRIIKSTIAFLWVSWLLSSAVMEIFDPLALLYLLRLSFYLLSFVYFVYLFSTYKSYRWINYLLISILLASIAGFIQYMYFPDLRFLYFLGWDDHLGRLVGLFLDPGFIGLIVVFGAVISFYLLTRTGKLEHYIYFALLCAATILTFSRASYVSWLVGISLLSIKANHKLLACVVFIAFALSVIFVNGGKGEGVKLTRTSSIIHRLDNYTETFEIFKSSPVFGVGYGNLCKARDVNPTSHSCYGADNGLVFLLATTGLAGVVFMVYKFTKILQLVSAHKILVISVLAVWLVSSMFANTLVYPFALAIVVYAISIGIAIRE